MYKLDIKWKLRSVAHDRMCFLGKLSCLSILFGKWTLNTRLDILENSMVTVKMTIAISLACSTNERIKSTSQSLLTCPPTHTKYFLAIACIWRPVQNKCFATLVNIYSSNFMNSRWQNKSKSKKWWHHEHSYYWEYVSGSVKYKRPPRQNDTK